MRSTRRSRLKDAFGALHLWSESLHEALEFLDGKIVFIQYVADLAQRQT
jgi:hypothetical protein